MVGSERHWEEKMRTNYVFIYQGTCLDPIGLKIKL